MQSSRMPVWACVFCFLLAAVHTAEANATPEAVRFSRDQQQLALVRERLAQDVRSAFLKDVDGGAAEEGDDEAEEEDEAASEGDARAPEDDDTEKLRKEVARLKKQLSTKKAEKAIQSPAPEEETEPFVEAAAEEPAKKARGAPARLPYSGQVHSLTPFGREDVGRELTERSIMESDKMVDQIEKAEVAEEKRAVYRALTRLRGAAINSFDGVAHSQVGNIDEYSTTHNFLNEHPLKHLAKEESNVAAWAFPNDEPKEPLMGLLEVPDDA